MRKARVRALISSLVIHTEFQNDKRNVYERNEKMSKKKAQTSLLFLMVEFLPTSEQSQSAWMNQKFRRVIIISSKTLWDLRLKASKQSLG